MQIWVENVIMEVHRCPSFDRAVFKGGAEHCSEISVKISLSGVCY